MVLNWGKCTDPTIFSESNERFPCFCLCLGDEVDFPGTDSPYGLSQSGRTQRKKACLRLGWASNRLFQTLSKPNKFILKKR